MLLNTMKFTGTADNFLIILELFFGRFFLFYFIEGTVPGLRVSEK